MATFIYYYPTPALTVVVDLSRYVFQYKDHAANPCHPHHPDYSKITGFKPTKELPGWLAQQVHIIQTYTTVNFGIGLSSVK